MSEAWRGLDLGGGGLQAANIRLAQALKRRSRAYARLAAFPLGLHRAYLDDPRGAWVYRAASLIALVAFAIDWHYALPFACLIAAAVVHDFFWIERRIVALNKTIRVAVYLSQSPGAPHGFKGQYTDEEASVRTPRAPSFAEQEKLLRELAKGRERS
ncbi:MAG: hypothetical protein WCE38_21430 [Burkholderiales bacterium]